MTKSEERKLRKCAEEAGVHLEEVPCSRCEGLGHALVADPLDLQLLREKAGASIYGFAASVQRPDGTLGVSKGFIKMVENPNQGNSARSRRAPHWLIEQYLDALKKDWKKSGKGDPFRSMRNLTLSDQRLALKERRERKAATQELKNRPIRKSDVYELVDKEPVERYEVLSVLSTGGVVIRRVDLEDGAPKALKKDKLLSKYRFVETA